MNPNGCLFGWQDYELPQESNCFFPCLSSFGLLLNPECLPSSQQLVIELELLGFSIVLENPLHFDLKIFKAKYLSLLTNAWGVGIIIGTH